MIHRVKQYGIARIVLTIYFTFLCGVSGAVIGWDINESIFGTLIAIIIGISLGFWLVDMAYKVRGKITIAMVIGIVVGALLTVAYFSKINPEFSKNIDSGLFVILALGSSLGLFTGADIDDAMQRAKDAVPLAALGGIIFAVGYFVITTLINIWAGDFSKILTDFIFSIKIFFMFLLLLPILGAIFWAPLSVTLDSFILDFEELGTEEAAND